MKFKTLGIAFLAAGLLTACSGGEESAEPEKQQENIKELVSDYSTGKIKGHNASITSQELTVADSEGDKQVYDISEEDFFVSIAPYEDQTHPWTNHSLTGCQGELVEKEFDVYIEDENGNVVVDEKMTSHQNGFIDLWLPRDQKFKTKIGYNGKTVESEISTFEKDPTCITTMQLM